MAVKSTLENHVRLIVKNEKDDLLAKYLVGTHTKLGGKLGNLQCYQISVNHYRDSFQGQSYMVYCTYWSQMVKFDKTITLAKLIPHADLSNVSAVEVRIIQSFKVE